MRPMRRRDWLAAAGAALVFPPRRARAAGAEKPPTSIDAALDQLETLIAPEALAAFYASPEDDARELNMGVFHIYLSRGWADYEQVPSLAPQLKARQVPPNQIFPYLVTVLWRRKHALPIDTPQVLQSIERQERLRAERRRQWAHVTDDREFFLWMRVIHFEQDSVRPLPDDGALDQIAKDLRKPTSVCALAQVQGHASADEPDARTLSLVRARVIVARLLRRGVDPARLVAHGLGTGFPTRPLGVDRRVEIFCLRRHWVPPATRPSP